MEIIRENKKLIYQLFIAILVMAIISLLLYKPFEHLLNNPETLKNKLSKLGNWGKLILILMMTIQVVLFFYQERLLKSLQDFVMVLLKEW